MKTREELTAEACRVRDQINALDKQEFRDKTLPACRALVGKAFAYRKNSYSCPSKPYHYWDVFRRVLAIDVQKDSTLYLLYEEVSIDSRGCARIETSSDWVAGMKHFFGAGWVPCKLSEYQTNKTRVLKEMHNLTALKAAIRRKD